MFGRVPLARRNLFAEPRRLAASAAGVGMAIMLILLLDGLWAGIEANITTYEDNVGAGRFLETQEPAPVSRGVAGSQRSRAQPRRG